MGQVNPSPALSHTFYEALKLLGTSRLLGVGFVAFLAKRLASPHRMAKKENRSHVENERL